MQQVEATTKLKWPFSIHTATYMYQIITGKEVGGVQNDNKEERCPQNAVSPLLRS